MLFVAGLLLASCDGTLFHAYRSVGGAWHKSDTLFFNNISGSCDVQVLELSVGVRHSAAYPYKDLWLQIEGLLGDSVVELDTLCCRIYDGDGRLEGSTAGALYQAEYFCKTLSWGNNRAVRINHIMGDTVLCGVYDVGIRLASPCRRQHAEK